MLEQLAEAEAAMTNRSGRWLPGVPGAEIERRFRAVRSDQISSGKIDSPESSAALAANAFGFFLQRAGDLPPLPECGRAAWPASTLCVEKKVCFPWRGGRHPVLDVLLVTPTALIGVESKRFEPFRGGKAARFSCAFWRPVWGGRMGGYERVRNKLDQNARHCRHLDAAQLVKHAFALRTQVQPGRGYAERRPVLFYVYAEPEFWPGGRGRIDEAMKVRHREEIAAFAREVDGDEVKFVSCSWRKLLAEWRESGEPAVREHAEAVLGRYAP